MITKFVSFDPSCSTECIGKQLSSCEKGQMSLFNFVHSVLKGIGHENVVSRATIATVKVMKIFLSEQNVANVFFFSFSFFKSVSYAINGN